jgi:hypothetical protein
MGSDCFQLQAFVNQQRLSCYAGAPKAGAQLHANAEHNNEAAAGEAYRLCEAIIRSTQHQYSKVLLAFCELLLARR